MFKGLFGFNVAVAKENLNATVERWADIFGVSPNYLQPTDFAVPGILGANIEVAGSYIHILAGETEKVPLGQFVANKGEGIFLVSFQVDNVEEAMKQTAQKGVKFVSDKPFPFPRGKVNFVHPKSMNGVQIEFLQIDK